MKTRSRFARAGSRPIQVDDEIPWWVVWCSVVYDRPGDVIVFVPDRRWLAPAMPVLIPVDDSAVRLHRSGHVFVRSDIEPPLSGNGTAIDLRARCNLTVVGDIYGCNYERVCLERDTDWTGYVAFAVVLALAALLFAILRAPL